MSSRHVPEAREKYRVQCGSSIPCPFPSTFSRHVPEARENTELSAAAVPHSTAQHSTAQHKAQHSTKHSTAQSTAQAQHVLRLRSSPLLTSPLESAWRKGQSHDAIQGGGHGDTGMYTDQHPQLLTHQPKPLFPPISASSERRGTRVEQRGGQWGQRKATRGKDKPQHVSVFTSCKRAFLALSLSPHRLTRLTAYSGPSFFFSVHLNTLQDPPCPSFAPNLKTLLKSERQARTRGKAKARVRVRGWDALTTTQACEQGRLYPEGGGVLIIMHGRCRMYPRGGECTCSFDRL